MKYKDMIQAVKLLEDEWDLGKKESGASKNLCAWIYLMELLEQADYITYYRENDSLVGFASYAKWNSKKHFFRKKVYKIIKNRLYKSKEIKDSNALKEYMNNYNYAPKKLENYFDGEVSMLIIDKKHRGKGIGKNLLQNVFNAAKKNNIKNLQILSDESCNYGIYEKLGCKKVYEVIIKNMEPGKLGDKLTEKAFIYEKKL